MLQTLSSRVGSGHETSAEKALLTCLNPKVGGELVGLATQDWGEPCAVTVEHVHTTALEPLLGLAVPSLRIKCPWSRQDIPPQLTSTSARDGKLDVEPENTAGRGA